MVFPAHVLSLMIASPGDVLEERNLTRDVVHEWNDLNSQRTGRVVLPISWETHSAPELGKRAQQVINEQVVDKCDVLVGIFWTRIGTPTGVEVSGTVEEIKRHVAAGKPALLYFSSAPVAPPSLDRDQYDALLKFRDWSKSNGLISYYENIADFREIFRKHLHIVMNSNEYISRVAPENAELVQFATNVSPPDDVGLSPEALELLLEAVKDRAGTIMSVAYLSGRAIQTNGRNFVESGDRRSIARWEAAIEELLSEALVKPQGYKGEIFVVTDKGYKFAEELAGTA